MNLQDAFARLFSLPEEATPFAARIDGRFQAKSPTTAYEIPEAQIRERVAVVVQQVQPGSEYFLEVATAREVISGWRESHAGAPLDGDEALELVIYHYQNDAFPSA